MANKRFETVTTEGSISQLNHLPPFFIPPFILVFRVLCFSWRCISILKEIGLHWNGENRFLTCYCWTEFSSKIIMFTTPSPFLSPVLVCYCSRPKQALVSMCACVCKHSKLFGKLAKMSDGHVHMNVHMLNGSVSICSATCQMREHVYLILQSSAP